MNYPDVFRDYMQSKKAKLRAQFKEVPLCLTFRRVQEVQSTLFQGVCIHVNGYTDPSSQELRQLVVSHGGTCETYGGPRVTHYIAESLPPSTIKRCTDGQRLVRPQWIIESIAQGKLLPWIDYRLYNLSEITQPGSLPISTHFSSISSASSSKSIPAEEPPASVFQEKDQEAAATHAPAAIEGPAKICTDAGFLESYYKHSRLHHLSDWKKKFQEELQIELMDRLECSPQLSETNGIFFHVDMDCFFASVTTHFHPELDGLPVGISHSRNPTGSADIAACNYQARSYGVSNGMWVRDALRLCPQLHIAPYEFNRYEQVSRTLFKTLLQCSPKLQIISCDEAYLDVTSIPDVEQVAVSLREAILNATGCTASIGIGGNRFLARMATKKAKPDGQYHILDSEKEDYLAPLSVRELPGVGRKLEAKLNSHDIHLTGDVIPHPLSWLQKEFGSKTGETLYSFARGIDSRVHDQQQERKSIGIDCNWGVRMTTKDETVQFLFQLSEELSNRLGTAKQSISSITLKLRVRSAGASIDPAKFLGLGQTDGFSRSITVNAPIHRAEDLHTHCVNLFDQIQRAQSFPISDLRGIGISGQKLSPMEEKQNQMSKQKGNVNLGRIRKTMTISQAFPRIPRPLPPVKVQRTDETKTLKQKIPKMKTSDPVTASQLDPEVFSELPEDLQQEIVQFLAPSKKAPVQIRPVTAFVDDSEEIDYHSRFSSPISVPIQSLKDILFQPLTEDRRQQVKCLLINIAETNLEDAQTALSLLHRKFSPDDRAQFEATLQEAVFAKYKGHLTT